MSVIKEAQGAAQWLYNRYRNGYQLDFGRLEELPFSEPDPEHRPAPGPVGRLQARAARAGLRSPLPVRPGPANHNRPSPS